MQALAKLEAGELERRRGPTLREAALAWIELAEAGTATNRSGDPYKPKVLRDYRSALERRVIPALGGRRLAEITSVDVQRFADRLTLEGLSPSGVRNALMPLRAVSRWHAARDGLPNPTRGVQLPAARGKRERIAPPAEAALLLEALPVRERAVWGTAFYAGLRSGELRALRWEDVSLAAGTIRVRRSWDQVAGEIRPKSRAGERTVPIPARLRELLIEHGLETRRSSGLVFGKTAEEPFPDTTLRNRARRAWKAAGLEPIGLHEARHSYASAMIAAGIGPKQLSSYMGHASIAITLDRYGHLLPNSERESAELLDAFLERTA